MDNTTHNTPREVCPCYRIIRIADPRSRGACAWFEVEAFDAGNRWLVATVDTRREAIDLVNTLEADHARRMAAK